MPRQMILRNYEIGLPECIIIDIDGTLALHDTRNPFDYDKCMDDKLNWPIWELIRMIQKCRRNLITIIITGRSNQEVKDPKSIFTDIKQMTEAWLHKHDIEYNQIYIRSPFNSDPDYKFKEDIYNQHIKDQYNTLYVIEDRKQVIEMYRGLGLTVLDVAGWDE